MSLAGYTAGAMGNREFHPFPQLLNWKLRNANFPHLSANLISPFKIKIHPYIILTRNGYRIAVIGLTLPQVRGFWERILPLRFSDPIPIGAELERELGECDFLIFLTHLGLGRDIRLARELRRPCLILGGHNHITLEKPLRVNECYIMHSGCYAKNYSLIEMDKGKVKGWLEKL